jgi:hypothetical protein
MPVARDTEPGEESEARLNDQRGGKGSPLDFTRGVPATHAIPHSGQQEDQPKKRAVVAFSKSELVPPSCPTGLFLGGSRPTAHGIKSSCIRRGQFQPPAKECLPHQPSYSHRLTRKCR